MPAYLVRLISNRDIVGLFAADDFDNLVVTVDECTDVSACEFLEMPDGGIIWSSPAIPVPIDLGDDESTEIPELPLQSAELSESWWSVIYCHKDGEWTRFDPDAPQDPPPEPKPPPMGSGKVVPLRPRKT
jgi:hypothetical protein